MDHLSVEKRSWNMSRIRSENTGPEIFVRRILHRLGFRYSLHRKDLPGSPDIVLVKYKTAFFVHGCFWHGHKGCKYASIPSSNRKFWIEKIERNRARDIQNLADLRKAGWKVVQIWQCELKDIEKLKLRIIYSMII